MYPNLNYRRSPDVSVREPKDGASSQSFQSGPDGVPPLLEFVDGDSKIYFLKALRRAFPSTPNVALVRTLRSSLDGIIWGILKGSWGVLVHVDADVLCFLLDADA